MRSNEDGDARAGVILHDGGPLRDFARERGWLIRTDTYDHDLKWIVAQPRGSVDEEECGLPYRFDGRSEVSCSDDVQISSRVCQYFGRLKTMLNEFRTDKNQLPALTAGVAAAVRARRSSRFDEVRSTCAPVIDAGTVLAAPFGWTGLMRLLGNRIGTRLKDSKIRIGLLAIMPAGISIELRQRGDAPDRTELHAMANDIATAAAALDAESGLLKERALSDLAVQLVTLEKEGTTEFDGIMSVLDGTDAVFRREMAKQLSEIRFGHRDGWPATTTKRVVNWKMSYPPGATCVEIVGRVDLATGGSIAEPVIALGRLKQWVLTVSGAYALDRESWELV